MNIQLKQLTPDALRSTESVVCCHFLDQANRLRRNPRFSRMRLGFVLPEQTEKLTVPSEKCLWLNQKERLLPGPCHPGQKHQEQAVRLLVYRSLDLSMKNDEFAGAATRFLPAVM